MRLALTVVIVIFTLGLLRYLGVGSKIDLLRAVPYFGGFRPGLYDLAGVAVIIIALWGVMRILRSQDHDDPDSSTNEEDDP